MLTSDGHDDYAHHVCVYFKPTYFSKMWPQFSYLYDIEIILLQMILLTIKPLWPFNPYTQRQVKDYSFNPKCMGSFTLYNCLKSTCYINMHGNLPDGGMYCCIKLFKFKGETFSAIMIWKRLFPCDDLEYTDFKFECGQLILVLNPKYISSVLYGSTEYSSFSPEHFI